MLDQLRGRNLAHVGCTIGLVAGLLLGLIGALIVIQVMQNLNAVNIATVVWLGATVALALLSAPTATPFLPARIPCGTRCGVLCGGLRRRYMGFVRKGSFR